MPVIIALWRQKQDKDFKAPSPTEFKASPGYMKLMKNKPKIFIFYFNTVSSKFNLYFSYFSLDLFQALKINRDP